MDSYTEEMSECILSTWKRERKELLSERIQRSLYTYEFFEIPSKRLRSNQTINLQHYSLEERERIFFDDFTTFCHGSNTRTMELIFGGKVQIKGSGDSNVDRWLLVCMSTAEELFELGRCLNEMRNDYTRGRIVHTFCSLVLERLQTIFFDPLTKIESKNMLALAKKCEDFRRFITPLRNLAQRIRREHIVGGELINFLAKEAETDGCFHIADLLREINLKAITCYSETIFEWISQCTLTSDRAMEFFIWDLSNESYEAYQSSKSNKHHTAVHSIRNINGFENRYRMVKELLPLVFECLQNEIYQIGRYFTIMKSNNANPELLANQYLLDFSLLDRKTTSTADICAVILRVNNEASSSLLRYLVEGFDIINFATRLPIYYLGINTSWIDRFVELFERKGYGSIPCSELKSTLLTELFAESVNNDRLRNDKFTRRFIVEFSSLYEPNTYNKENIVADNNRLLPLLELNITGNPAYEVAFPNKITEPYRKLFYLRFELLRASHLIHCKRYYSPDFSPGRVELVTLNQLIKFINRCCEYIFVNTVEDIYKEFAEKIKKVKNIEELVSTQHDYFLATIFDKSKLTFDDKSAKLTEKQTTFLASLEALLRSIIDYSDDQITFEEFSHESTPYIGKMKQALLRGTGNRELRSLLFGSNCESIGSDVEGQELWRLLKKEWK